MLQFRVMKRIIIGSVLLGVGIIAVLFVKLTMNKNQGVSDDIPLVPTQYYMEIDSTELIRKINSQEDYVLIDTRTKEEYDAGHIPTAINIPYDHIDDLTNYPFEDKSLIVYCTLSSWRAPYAAYSLSKSGKEDVSLLKGGIYFWEQDGGEIVATNEADPIVMKKPADLLPQSPVVVDKTVANIIFTTETLATFNGQNGNASYVAYEGIVYDVTESPLWVNGVHRPAFIGGFVEVKAGRDLTVWLTFAPHGVENIKRFPVVGSLE